MSADRKRRPEGTGAERTVPEPGGGDAEPSVLGSLPRTRPAVRSPRREASGKRPAATGAAAPEARPSSPPSPSPSGPLGGLEGLARDGAAAAVGVASLGLRIAGRATTALRDAVERR